MTHAVLITSSLTALPAAGAGLFAAGHAASWGAFKDSPFEGFRLRSYARTFVLGALIAALLSAWLPLDTAAGVAVLVGVTYALERLATEWWKSVIRNDDQAAYTIPMRLGFLGRPIESPRVRWAVGAAVILVVVAGLVGLHLFQTAMPSGPWWLTVPLVGGLGGWATAVGGAWKDAPIEGFSPWKFLRSPAVATLWALPLGLLTSSWPALLMAAAGYAVISIETYKTFFTDGRPPGKFADKPVRWLLPRLRSVLALQNAAWWFAFAGLLLSVVTALPAGRGPSVSAGHALLAALTAAATVVALRVVRAEWIRMTA